MSISTTTGLSGVIIIDINIQFKNNNFLAKLFYHNPAPQKHILATLP